MKKERLIKIFVSIIISSIAILCFSSRTYAGTGQTDAIIASFNNGVNETLGEAGIYQTDLLAYMTTDIKISDDIATERSRYGIGETLKIRFSFNRAISSVTSQNSNTPQVVIKFGNGSNKVVTNYSIAGSYLEFSYNLQAGDTGGLTIVSVDAIVTDSEKNSRPLGLNDKGSYWTNAIIADTTVTKIEYSGSTIYSKYKPIYIKKGNTISKITPSDVYYFTGMQNWPTVDYYAGQDVKDESPSYKAYNLDTNMGSDPLDKICIPNAVDIAGNPVDQSAVHSADYAIKSITSTKTTNSDGNQYLKAEDTITIIARCTADTSVKVKFGTGREQIAEYDSNASAARTDGNNVFTYIVQEGDNGPITASIPNGTCVCGTAITNASKTAENIIADTIAPVITLKQITAKANTGRFEDAKTYNYLEESSNFVSSVVNKNSNDSEITSKKYCLWR